MLKLVKLVKTKTPKLDKKEAKNPKAKKANFQKPKEKKCISVIIVELPVILDQIAISGQPLNKAMA